MVNVMKQRTKALQRFKSMHINTLISKGIKSERREDNGFVYEDVLFRGTLLGSFIFDKKTNQVTFKEEPANDVPNQR